MQNRKIKWHAAAIAAIGVVTLGALAAAVGQQQTASATGTMSIGGPPPNDRRDDTGDHERGADHESNETRWLLENRAVHHDVVESTYTVWWCPRSIARRRRLALDCAGR